MPVDVGQDVGPDAGPDVGGASVSMTASVVPSGMMLTFAVPGLFTDATVSFTEGTVAFGPMDGLCAPDTDGISTDVTVSLSGAQVSLLTVGTVIGTVTPLALAAGGGNADAGPDAAPDQGGASVAVGVPIGFAGTFSVPVSAVPTDLAVTFGNPEFWADQNEIVVGSTLYLHIPVSAVNNATGAAADPSALTLQVALVQIGGDDRLQTGYWQPASWQATTDAVNGLIYPVQVPGLSAELLLTALAVPTGASGTISPGYWRVFVSLPNGATTDIADVGMIACVAT